jgi:hypothetical protein
MALALAPMRSVASRLSGGASSKQNQVGTKHLLAQPWKLFSGW